MQRRLARIFCGAAAHPTKRRNFIFSKFLFKKIKNVKILIHLARSLKKKHKNLKTEYAIHSNNMATLLAVLLFWQLSVHMTNKHEKLLK